MSLFLSLLACTATPWGVRPELEISEAIPTVATVRVQPDEAVDALWIELEDGRTVSASLVGDTWEATFIAAPPQTSFTWQVGARRGSRERTTGAFTDRTGLGPAGYPELEVEILDPKRAHQGVVLTTLMGAPTGPVLLDHQGRYLWWHQHDDDTATVGRARLDLQGLGLWHNTHVLGGSRSSLVWVSLDGNATETVEVYDFHHDFWLLSDGSLAWLQGDVQLVDGLTVEGDKVMERTPEGEETQIYSIWDDVEYVEDQDVVPGPGWSHANTLVYDEHEERLLISFMGLDSVFEVDRASGVPTWILGGPVADLQDASGETALLSRPHQPEWTDEGLLVFDNGERNRGDSRVLQFDLDPEAGLAETTWSWSPDPERFCFAMGDVQRLPDGSTLVDFSAVGILEQVSPEGEVLWRMTAESPSLFGYADWLASP